MNILPSKFLIINLNSIDDHDVWMDDSGSSQWDWYAYQWKLTGSINVQQHSSNKTPDPFQYSGTDVKVGDWFSDDTGRTFKIVEIVNASAFDLEMVIEDVEQFNTITDPSGNGNGMPQSYSGFIFSLNEEGTPDLQNMPVNQYNSETFVNTQSRFIARNNSRDFVTVYQTNSGLSVGDFIMVDAENEGRYLPCPSDKINFAIGVVNGVDVPKTNSFTFKPLTEIIEDLEPGLEGEYGDIFYMDPANPGKVTGIKPESKPKPVYIRLETPNRAVRLNAIVDDSTDAQKTFVVVPTSNQTQFTLPAEASDVMIMSINGIENKNFTFDKTSKVLTFDPNATGYGVDNQDEVIFIYQA